MPYKGAPSLTVTKITSLLAITLLSWGASQQVQHIPSSAYLSSPVLLILEKKIRDHPWFLEKVPLDGEAC